MQRPRDVPLDHLRAVSQYNQGRDGAQAPGLEIHLRTVVNLAVDYCVHQPHDVRSQFRHGCRRLRVVFRTVVMHPELRGGFLEVDGVNFVVDALDLVQRLPIRNVVAIVRLALILGLVGTQI